MADNVVASAGSGGATFATDDILGVHHPRSKIEWGPDGTANETDDATGKRLPVKVGEALPAGTNNIGDVDVLSLPAVTGTVAVSTLPALVAGTANIGDVDVASLPPLVAGSAKIGAVDLDSDATTGAAVPAVAQFVAGTDGTLARALKTDAGGELQVDVLTLPSVTIGAALPAGTANIGDVDVASLPALPAGANNIGDVDVLSLPALPAGTNNIGDVDVASVVPGTGATALGKAVDLAAGATDTGVAALAVRDDALTTLTPVDGDYVPLRVNSLGALHVTGGGGGSEFAEDAAHVSGDLGSLVLGVRRDADTTPVSLDGDYHALQFDPNGNLKVAIKSGAGSGGTSIADDAAFTPGTTSITPVGGTYRVTRDLLDDADAGAMAMTQKRAVLTSIETPAGDSAMDEANDALRVNIVAGAGSGGTAMTDDAAFTPAVTAVTPMAAMADEVTPDSVDEGDAGALRMSLNRNLYTQIRDGTAERSAAVSAANALKVDGSAVTQPVSGTVAVSTLPALVAGTANIGDVDVLSLPALPAGANNIGDVDVLTLPALPAGTNNIGDVDVLTLPGVAGTVAHDGVDSGNPVKTGGKAVAHGANPTAVAAADRSDHLCNRHGIPFSIGGHPNVVTLTNEYTAAQTDVALVTVGAGLKIVVVGYMVGCDKANTVNVEAKLGFGATIVPASGAGVIAWHPGIDPGGGFARGNGGGILGVGADNEDLRFTCSVPTTGSVTVSVQYYTIES